MGKEERIEGASKYTNENLSLSEGLLEKQVHKGKTALTTAIMLSFVVLGGCI